MIDRLQLSLGHPTMINGPLSELHCFQPLRGLPHNPFSPQYPSQLHASSPGWPHFAAYPDTTKHNNPKNRKFTEKEVQTAKSLASSAIQDMQIQWHGQSVIYYCAVVVRHAVSHLSSLRHAGSFSMGSRPV